MDLNTEEIAVSFEEVNRIAEQNLDFLAALAMPQLFRYNYPQFYHSLWGWLRDTVAKPRDFSQLALGLPRGFGKTIFLKLFILYCILFTNRKFILVMCETQTKGNNIIADVIDMLNEPNIKSVFGDWKLGVETDRQDLRKFGYRGRNIILMAGTVEGIRGITLKNERPDVMIFDDIQSRVCAESQIQSENLEREMMGTAMKAKSPHGCLFIFVANMYPTKWSILRRLKQNPNWFKIITGGILHTGESLWEELHPIEQLKREFQNDLAAGRAAIFYAEVLNDETAQANNLIDLSALPPLPYAPDDIPQGKFIVIDPSSGKLTSDMVAIGYFEVFDGYPVLRSLVNERLSPGDTISKALALALNNNCRLIAIESVAYQSTLAYWFKFICDQRGIVGIEAVEVYPGSFSKNSRIHAMLKSLAAGDLFLDPSVKAEVFLQITQWNPLKKDNIDDILDLLCYPSKVIELYGEYVMSCEVIPGQEYAAIEVIPAELNCCF